MPTPPAASAPVRVALVTGASSGIGASAAIRLSELGFTVYAGARRVDRMSALEPHGIRVLPLDVTDDLSMTSAVDRILAETGRIDVLVNNAGYGSYGSVEDVPIDEGRRQFEVNVFGLARLTQLVLPTMRAQASGRVVNISSIGGKVYEALGAWYHATKFAVEGFSDSLRLELAPFGIKVVIIEPGAIRTEWGGIAAGSAIERSGDTAYAAQAAQLARVYSTADRPNMGSEPDVVARAIGKAATVKRPRARYAVGSFAKPIVWSRKLLPDAAMDFAMRAAYSTQ
jgi:NAD(P)-dependent dehydrogenase (short-subunit alcohol dehydrogenase family)